MTDNSNYPKQTHKSTDPDMVTRYYGVDFGSRNIMISRTDVSNQIIKNNLSHAKIDILTDNYGYRSIFNGMQYINLDSNSDRDSSSYYNKRKFGNECTRSHISTSISNSIKNSNSNSNTNNNLLDSHDNIEINDNKYSIPRNISEVAINGISVISKFI